jgi:2-keto-4-pentenoate hydratase/2-oxohepta-3-ene-1,7-dioic acid hydratase in catechol pathway
MRIIRFRHKGNSSRFGWILEDKVGPINGDIYSEYQREEADVPLSEVDLLAPVTPSKIVCVGRNYAAHAAEHGAEVPESPLIFLKPPSSVIAPGDPILLPPQSNQVEHEAELGVVIGKKARWLQPEECVDHIFGYTLVNDVTARDLQRRDGQWTRSKGFDTFCPVGPWIDTEFDPSDTMVYITSVMTLEPGDLVLTGTPSGVGVLRSGDTVSITIEGLGELNNPVKTDPRRKE